MELSCGFEVEVDGEITKMFHPPGYAPDRPISTPIFIAAGGPKGLKVAAEVGDGLLCAGVVPPSPYATSTSTRITPSP